MAQAEAARVIEVIEEAGLSPETDLALRQLLQRCFDAESNAFFATSRHWHGSKPLYSVVGRVAGERCAHVGVVVRRVRCGPTQVTVAGIQNVCVLPSCRGMKLGPWVMEAAMREAVRRQVPFGLLFCVPELERYYAGMGWITTRAPAIMNLNGGPDEPIPGKNIGMYWTADGSALPEGPIHLQGPDW
jgi:predicted N-acetyltransferase YhbS